MPNRLSIFPPLYAAVRAQLSKMNLVAVTIGVSGEDGERIPVTYAFPKLGDSSWKITLLIQGSEGKELALEYLPRAKLWRDARNPKNGMRYDLRMVPSGMTVEASPAPKPSVRGNTEFIAEKISLLSAEFEAARHRLSLEGTKIHLVHLVTRYLEALAGLIIALAKTAPDESRASIDEKIVKALEPHLKQIEDVELRRAVDALLDIPF